MAITENTFTGNGSNLGPFTFTFQWLESPDIKVTVNGVLKVAGTHYNLQNLNYTTKTGGQVLFIAGNAPANGAVIRIYRNTDDTTPSSTFYSGSAIRSQDLNDNFLQNLYIAQETNNNVAGAVAGQIPDNSIGTSKLVDQSVTAAKIADGVTSSKFAFVQSGAGATSRTVENKLKDVVSVKDFGAVGDGVADDYAAFAAALATGNAVYIPKGTYKLTQTVTVSGTKQQITCDSGVYWNYTGTGAALVLTGSNHDISLGEIGAANGTHVIVYYNLGFSRIYVKACGQCSQAVIYHNATLQTENEGNCIWTIDRLEAGSVPYGIKIDSHATYIHEGSLFDVKVLFSATNTGIVVGTALQDRIRWNRFIVCPDASGITPLLLDVYNSSNSFYINDWQGTPAATHVRFNTNVNGNYLFASPGVQSGLTIVDNGNNFKQYPDTDLRYKIQQGGNILKLDDNSVGILMNSVAGGFRVFTGDVERLRISNTGAFTTDAGTMPVSFARAWVSFTVSGGVVTVSAASNVSSVTRTAAGEFEITFTTPMPDASYAITGTCTYTGAWIGVVTKPATKISSKFSIFTGPPGGAAVDPSECSVVIHR